MREKVLGALARKSYCSWELRQKFADLEEIDSLIEEFQQKGYINDSEWLEAFIAAKERCGNSPLAIGAKLRNKGVPREVIMDLLGAHSPEEALKQAIYKKTKGKIVEGPEKQKLIASLLRKGFSWNLIRNML